MDAKTHVVASVVQRERDGRANPFREKRDKVNWPIGPREGGLGQGDRLRWRNLKVKLDFKQQR